eukprot:scaffold24821_cov84-Amphora_coffeaeformis.AAC.1
MTRMRLNWLALNKVEVTVARMARRQENPPLVFFFLLDEPSQFRVPSELREPPDQTSPLSSGFHMN